MRFTLLEASKSYLLKQGGKDCIQAGTGTRMGHLCPERRLQASWQKRARSSTVQHAKLQWLLWDFSSKITWHGYFHTFSATIRYLYVHIYKCVHKCALCSYLADFERYSECTYVYWFAHVCACRHRMTFFIKFIWESGFIYLRVLLWATRRSCSSSRSQALKSWSTVTLTASVSCPGLAPEWMTGHQASWASVFLKRWQSLLLPCSKRRSPSQTRHVL